MITAFLAFFFFLSDSTVTVVVESSQQLFGSAVSCSLAPDGMLFVVDQKKNTLHQISSSNTIVRTIGGKGWGTTEFDLPLDVSSSFLLDLFVVDGNNQRIQRFDKHFNFLQTYDELSITQMKERFKPRACAVSSLGDLYVIELDGNRIIKISPRGVYEREFGTFKDGKGSLIEPKDIAVTMNDEIVVLDKECVIVFDRFGNFLRKIFLSGNDEWRTISVSEDILCLVSSQKITLINIESSEQRTILPQTILGAAIDEPFTDAVIQNSALIILTPTTLFRCSLTQ